MENTISLGSLYFDGKAVPIGSAYNGEEVSFGDTVPGKGIPFIKWRDNLVADRCVCINISWKDLDKLGFIFGWPVTINGAFYLCRAFKAGVKKGIPNEWDSILDDIGEDDNLWHWNHCFSWGQESYASGASSRVVRGYHSARGWRSLAVDLRDMGVGFRPVLERLPPEAPVSDTLIGHTIEVFVDRVSVTGYLIGYSDYDLEVKIKSPLPQNSSWFRGIKDIVYIDREAVDYLRNV